MVPVREAEIEAFRDWEAQSLSKVIDTNAGSLDTPVPARNTGR